MKNKLYPCLWFDGKAKEAATFYTTIFNPSSIISENPVVVFFELNGNPFMALNGGPMFQINPSISFFVFCETTAEVEEKWKGLTNGGAVLMPLDKYPWNEKYGWCQDKYGVNWQLMVEKNAVQNIAPALMFTKFTAGKAEEAMQFYTQVFNHRNEPGGDNKILSVSLYEKGEPDVEGTIKHARFLLNGQLFCSMDSSAAHSFSFNEGVSIVVPCETQDDIDYFWEQLSEGGSKVECGWLKDKYDVCWQIVPASLSRLMDTPEKREKVMKAVMSMKKLDIAALERAANS